MAMQIQRHEVSTVKSVQFGMMSKEQIERMSVVEVTEGTFYDSNGDPKLNSLFDPRMGVIERGRKCKTCEQDYILCPGHPGHISLSRPIFNIQFDKEIIKLAKCFCCKCGKLLINKEHALVKAIMKANRGKKRFKRVFKLIFNTYKVGRCGTINEADAGGILDNGGCGALQPDKYVNAMTPQLGGYLVAQWRADRLPGALPEGIQLDASGMIEQKMNAEYVLAWFKRITPEDASVMAMSPEWCMPSYLIIETVPVVPPACRPSVRQYNGQRSEDDITHKYIDIIKHNNILKDALASGQVMPENQLQMHVNVIMYHVMTLHDNDGKKLNQSTTRTYRPIKSFICRLKGKEGRIRSNLMGKRVDFSARSVISPDANIKMSELGVPLEIAMNLTYPEVVNKYNINEMYKLIRNGNKIYPGAKRLESVKKNTSIFLMDNILEDIILEYGDVVHRHLRDGDYVLFNRQPTLHRMSMMAHVVKVMPGKTFRFNTDDCECYNADFDGDEMNMHVPQSLQTAMELKYLAAIPHHMISPSTNSPIIKPAQDNLLGMFKITGDGVLLTQIEASHLLSGTQAFNGVLPEPEVREGKYIRWTGKQIYSIILPPISLSAEPKSDKVPKVVIEYGKLKQGQIDKSVSGKILQAIHIDFGSKEAERYMNDLQTIISRYLIKTGFSVGVSDLVIHPDIIKKNRDAVKKAITDEIDLAKRVHLNILEEVNGNLSQVYETKVMAIGTDLDKKVIANTIKTLDYRTNRILFMVTSGAKGNDTNIKQMMCCLGQQSIDGGRVPIGFTDRTLPHYPRYENGMEARGFVAHNFIEGLNPQEFFFHAQSGREGLIDTAVKTANSGYLQRRLVKTTEDLKTYHDYTIRDSNNEIIEFIYGNDGFDTVKIESQSSNFKLIKTDKLYRDYLFTEDEAFEEYMLSKSITKMKADPGWFKKLDAYNKSVQRALDMIHVQMVKFIVSIDDLTLYYPVNMKKLVTKVSDVYELDKVTKKSVLLPTDIIDELEALINDCRINGLRNHVLEVLVYDYLSPKKLLRDLHITRQAFDFIIAQVKLGFRKGRVEAGEMVGPLAAQSIGERSTQLSVLGTEEITLIEQLADGTRNVYSGPIGKYIDSYFESAVESVNYVGPAGDNTNAFINIMRNVSVLTVDPKTEKTNWKPISQISRHPANGGMVKVTTKSQRNITTTLSHSHLKRTPDGIVPVRGDELQVGDRIPVSSVNVLAVPMTESNEIFWDEIVSIEVLPDPGELVYDIGVEDNHTFALNSGIFTHNTLNSVDWETDMLLSKAGMPFEIKMGQFIDDLLDKYKASGKIQYIPENRTEYLELDDYIEVPSVDKFGNVSWCQVTAVTRHLPVGDLVKVTTDSGREVSATQQKSFLTWNEETQELVDTNGADLKVGDLVPITYVFPEPEPDKVITHLDFSKYLPKTEYLYGTEFHKAGELHDADTRAVKMGFWQDNQGKTFTIPYSRLDAFMDAWRGKKMTQTVIEKGYIYPKLTNKSHSKIPERIVLDAEFGFIIGLYLAEGWATDTFWGISNNEECIRQRVINWCEKLSLSYTVRQFKDKKVKVGTPEEYTITGTTTDVIIHGVFWPRFLKKWVGTGSAFKRVPAEAYVAPLEFVKGLLDGYISGDGCVQLDGRLIVTSVSKQLITGISSLCARFGIFGRMSTHKVTKPESSRIKTENCLPYHALTFSVPFTKVYAENIGCFHPMKKDRLENITLKKITLNTTGKYRVTKHIVLDEIKEIAHHPSSKEYVYDLTVPKTLNFSLASNYCVRDTFHTAGTASAGKVTQGVPRLNEMLTVTNDPKTPCNIIYLKDVDRFDRERAERVKNSIEQTKIGEILKSDPAFYLEPTNKLDSVLDEDRDFMKFYEVFAELHPVFKEIPKNPWVIRLEFDRREMINRNVSMADVAQILKYMYPEAKLMYSDDNSGKLVFRIRMPFETREHVEDDFKYLKNKVTEIKKIIIKGVDNIEQVYMSEPSKDCILKGKECKGFSKPGEVYEVQEEYHMTTDGANLFDLLCRDDVDANRTYSIDPNEMNSIFGIEAAKLIVEQQFRHIMTSAGAMTSPRHVSLLVDKMAHTGEFMSVDRHGISKEDIGPLAKCSFERTPDELREAALFGDIDRLKGVSANIMVGQIPECGTGTIKIFLDEDMLAEELAKRGVNATELDEELDEKAVFMEFQQKMCINDDNQIKINLKTHHDDGLSLSQIPDVMVD